MRGYWRDGVTNTLGDAIVGALVSVVNAGTSTLVSFPLYADDEPNTATVTNPVLTNEQGEYAFWFDQAFDGRYEVVVNAGGYPLVREIVQLVAPASVQAINAAVAAEAALRSAADTTLQTNVTAEASTRASADSTHAAAADPHPQYLTQAEGDARYLLQTSPTVGVDSALRTYIRTIMAVLDPGGPPPP